MSKLSLLKIGATLAATAVIGAGGIQLLRHAGNHDWQNLPADAGDIFRRAIRIPGGTYITGSREPGSFPVTTVVVQDFYMWPVEVPLGWWHEYRPQTDSTRDEPALPATMISHDAARAFCRWFSERYGVRARLPTAAEWQVAARAGTGGIIYPWGWDHPGGRAVFNDEATRAVATHPPNAWGMYEMSGNVAEWTADLENDRALVMGGSWAERDPAFLRISHRLALPVSYAGRDVGFRIVIDPPSR